MIKRTNFTKTTYRLKLKNRKRIRGLSKFMVLILILATIIFGIIKIKNRYQDFFVNNINQANLIASKIKKSDFTAKKPSKIVDKNGKTLKTLTSINSDNNYVKLKDINPTIKKGLVAVEDQRFYEHHGVDIFGTLRAIVASHSGGGVQGGSTLTQQLVKNVILQDQNQTYTRKLKEMVIAQDLEKKYTKNQILEFYLNNISYNHNNLGINSAAHYYFDKNQKNLTVAQSAMLIGLINNPSYYDPESNKGEALEKRNEILKVWLNRHVINKKEYKGAYKEKLNLKITPTKVDNDVSHNYALSYALNEATIDLMHESGFNEEYWWNTNQEKQNYLSRFNNSYNLAREQILQGGYVITTDINPEKQQDLQNIVNKIMGNTSNTPNELQTSITVIDNSTGEVAGIQGGRNPNIDTKNRAYLGYHQPGSTAKMLVAYPEAFERGYRPQSIVVDSAIPNGPKNWYSGYRGSMTIRNAIAQSVNTPAFKLASEVSPKTYIDKLKKMQFDNLSPSDANPIISIGGFTNGVTTTQMASGYSTLTRQGDFISPTNVTKITYNNKTIYQNPETKVSVFTPDASYMSIDAMKSVMTGNGSGASAKLSNYPYVAGKTGTTDNNNDSYFVGMTPQYTIAVWVGHDKNGQGELSQAQLDMPKSIFKQVGELYSQGEPKVDFTKPDSIIKSGDNIYVNNSSKGKTSQEILNEKSQNTINQRTKENKKRRDNLAYRIIYHLSLAQEKSREDKVQKILDDIDIQTFSKEKQMIKFQEKINKAKYYNTYVRRKNIQENLNIDIINKQAEIAKKYATLVAEKQAIKNSKLEQAKQKAINEVEEDKQEKISDLRKQLSKQKDKVRYAYANDDSDKEEQKEKLVTIINKLRALGDNIPDENITVLEK